MIISKKNILKFKKHQCATFINPISGFKSANLIGIISSEGKINLAIFSSVIHFGANPPLIGFLMRPVSVERHKYNNIKETGSFTINHIHKEIFKQAHQTSARYEKDISEFNAMWNVVNLGIATFGYLNAVNSDPSSMTNLEIIKDFN